MIIWVWFIIFILFTLIKPTLYTGNQITGKIAYHFADLIAVYPITPSTAAS